jgi:uncharacterized protein YdhG (YjbR/CyaY superfamily)
MSTEAERHDAWVADQPEDRRTAIADLAAAVLAAAPDAEKAMSYGTPAWRLHGRPLAGVSAAARHLSYLPFSPAVVEAHADRLAGWGTSRGAIRFTPDRPLPADLVASLVAARRAEIER